MQQAQALAMGLVLLQLGGCFVIDRGCDDFGYCRIGQEMVVGRLDDALLERAFVEVCVDSQCATKVMNGGSRTASFQELGARITSGADTNLVAVIRLEVSTAGIDLDSPPTEARITVTVSSFERVVLLTGTFFMESETLTNPQGERCGRCRSTLLYMVPRN